MARCPSFSRSRSGMCRPRVRDRARPARRVGAPVVKAGCHIGETLRPAAGYICSCKWKELDSPWASSLISLTSSPSAARAARRRSAPSRVDAQTQCNGSATSGLRTANTYNIPSPPALDLNTLSLAGTDQGEHHTMHLLFPLVARASIWPDDLRIRDLPCRQAGARPAGRGCGHLCRRDAFIGRPVLPVVPMSAVAAPILLGPIYLRWAERPEARIAAVRRK
jgi:hypothetical protein